MRSKFLPAALLGIVLSGAAGIAQAQQTASNTFNVQIVVTETCEISATGEVNFGSQTRAATPAQPNATGTLTVNCSAGTPTEIALSGGVQPDGGTRRMVSGTAPNLNYLPYTLHQDSSTGTPWGDDDDFGDRLVFVGTGNDETINVYGVITGLNVPAGTYADTVTATITY